MQRTSPYLVTLAALALLVAWLADVVAPGFDRGIDFVQMHAFYRRYHAASLAAGRLPLWNPHVELGRPFLADIETASLYPPNLLALVLPQPWAVGVLVALHLAIAATGAAVFARACGGGRPAAAAAGLAFICIAPVQARLLIGQVQFTEAISWLPWIMVATVWLLRRPTRRTWLAVAGLVAWQILAGHPQAVWISVVAAGLLAAGWHAMGPGLGPRGPDATRTARDAGLLLTAIATGAGLAAVQVLPTAELARESNRATPALAFAASFAVEPGQLVTLLAAPAPTWRVNWEQNVFLGVGLLASAAGGIVAAVRRPRLRPLAGVAGVSLVFALGTATPLFAAFYAAVPGTSALRFPGRLFIAGGLAVAALAAAAIHRPPRAALRLPAAAIAAAIALAAAVARAWIMWQEREQPAPSALCAAAAGVLAAACISAVFAVGRRSPLFRPLAGAAFACVALEYACAVYGFKHLHSTAHGPWRQADEYPAEAAVTRALEASGLTGPGLPPPRVAGGTHALRPNSGMEWGYSSPLGYGALALDRVWWQLFTESGEAVPTELNTVPILPRLDREPVRFQGMDVRAWAVETAADEVAVTRPMTEIPAGAGRAWLAARVEPIAAWRQAARAMWRGHDAIAQPLVEERFLDRLPVELVSETRSSSAPASSLGTAHVGDYKPERFAIDVTAAAPSLLVVAEPWYPGWVARIVGPESGAIEIIPVNGWMRGVAVPAGESRIEMAYEPSSLWIGAAISGMCAAAWLAAWFWKASLWKDRR
ncbi:hypothetical protein EBR56_01365 [bacterium]|nr:hypothetical protein [bacterium]